MKPKLAEYTILILCGLSFAYESGFSVVLNALDEQYTYEEDFEDNEDLQRLSFGRIGSHFVLVLSVLIGSNLYDDGHEIDEYTANLAFAWEKTSGRFPDLRYTFLIGTAISPQGDRLATSGRHVREGDVVIGESVVYFSPDDNLQVRVPPHELLLGAIQRVTGDETYLQSTQDIIRPGWGSGTEFFSRYFMQYTYGAAGDIPLRVHQGIVVSALSGRRDTIPQIFLTDHKTSCIGLDSAEIAERTEFLSIYGISELPRGKNDSYFGAHEEVARQHAVAVTIAIIHQITYEIIVEHSDPLTNSSSSNNRLDGQYTTNNPQGGAQTVFYIAPEAMIVTNIYLPADGFEGLLGMADGLMQPEWQQVTATQDQESDEQFSYDANQIESPHDCCGAKQRAQLRVPNSRPKTRRATALTSDIKRKQPDSRGEIRMPRLKYQHTGAKYSQIGFPGNETNHYGSNNPSITSKPSASPSAGRDASIVNKRARTISKSSRSRMEPIPYSSAMEFYRNSQQGHAKDSTTRPLTTTISMREDYSLPDNCDRDSSHPSGSGCRTCIDPEFQRTDTSDPDQGPGSLGYQASEFIEESDGGPEIRPAYSQYISHMPQNDFHTDGNDLYSIQALIEKPYPPTIIIAPQFNGSLNFNRLSSNVRRLYGCTTMGSVLPGSEHRFDGSNGE